MPKQRKWAGNGERTKERALSLSRSSVTALISVTVRSLFPLNGAGAALSFRSARACSISSGGGASESRAGGVAEGWLCTRLHTVSCRPASPRVGGSPVPPLYEAGNGRSGSSPSDVCRVLLPRCLGRSAFSVIKSSRTSNQSSNNFGAGDLLHIDELSENLDRGYSIPVTSVQTL